VKALAKAAQQKAIDLVVVGPEIPLAAGIVDHFEVSAFPFSAPANWRRRLNPVRYSPKP